MKIKLIGVLTFVVLLSAAVPAQFRMNDFIIRKSSFQTDLIEIKAANPKLSEEELVAAANELIRNKGVNFVFGFDDATCQKIASAKANQKDKTQPLNLRASLTSVGGDARPTPLMLPEANFEKSQCLPCFMQLSVFEITAADFVTSIMGANIKFILPKNFITLDVQLVDDTDLTKVVRTWKIPFLAEPLSVSSDGNILYIGFDEPELRNFTLLLFGEGTFLIGTKKDIDPDQKISVPKDFPQESMKRSMTYRTFNSGESSHTVRYSKVCVE